METKNRTTKLTGTALLAALVIVFDYTLKYSGLKIPFPWYPNLKFDFTGVPITLSLLLYGTSSAITTSLVAGLGIFARSGNLVSASIKSIAELSSILGLALGFYLSKRVRLSGNQEKIVSLLIGLISRILIMTIVNIQVLPNVYGVPIGVTYGLLPLIGVFNAIQGTVTLGLGFFLQDAIKTRLRS